MELKKFVIANDFFSLTIHSNKSIPIPSWFLQFLTDVPKKKNLEITLLFNNKINKKSIKPKIVFFLYDKNRFQGCKTAIVTTIKEFQDELNILLLHASCININSYAYPFIAPSESGKTTLVKAMKDYFEVIHDDTLFVHNFSFISPFPFSLSPDLLTNKTLPIKELILVKKGNMNQFCDISKKEAEQFIAKNIITNTKETLHKFIKQHKIKLLKHFPFNKAELREVLLRNANSIPN